jgi:hypothetical protein
MRTRLDIMIHVDMDCDELLLGGVKAVTAMLSGTCVTWAQSRSNVSVALVRCMALSPLSREINVDRSLKSLKRAHVKSFNRTERHRPPLHRWLHARAQFCFRVYAGTECIALPL